MRKARRPVLARRARGAIRLALLWCAAFSLGCRGSNTIVDGKARFCVLTPSLIRIEYADDGRFEDGVTFNRAPTNLAPPRCTTRVHDDWREIETDDVIVRYRRGTNPFDHDNLTVQLRRDQRTVALPSSAVPAHPLGGWMRALDNVSQPLPLHPGLLNREGVSLLDDSTTALIGGDGWLHARTPHAGTYTDQYIFAYGHDYGRALADLAQLFGPPPLLPRWTFGIWYSRYFPYADSDYRNDLIKRFRADAVPLDVLIIDTDWKAPDPVTGQTWNGWRWNPRLFPDPNGFLRWTAGEGLHVALNVHPSISSNDPDLAAVTRDAGPLEAIADHTYGWDWGNRKQARSYLALHDPLEAGGVRFWWLDWCCEKDWVDVPGGTGELASPDGWVASLYAARAEKRGLRGFAFQRVGGRFAGYAAISAAAATGPWPDRRYAIHFTGDTAPTWEMLGFAVSFTIAEGATGFPYVSHDIGSFNGKHLPEDLYLRWLQLGTFQPIFRLHSNHGDRLPWDYSDTTRALAEQLMRLRESLVPYLYTLGREAYDTGMPLVRALYLAHPDDAHAYAYDREYLLGDALLVIPITTPDGTATAWFPPGTWTNIFTGELRTGPSEQTVSAGLDTMPVYAHAGAIIPRQPPMRHVGERAVDPLLIDIYAGADGAFDLYEDEGEGLGYRDGQLRRQSMRYSEAQRRFTIAGAVGHYRGAPEQRAYELRIIGVEAPARVLVGGRALPSGRWRHDEARHTLSVPIATRAVADALVVELR
jgi:alpha-glucosidase (family GH31 glycosyl hydrolase)